MRGEHSGEFGAFEQGVLEDGAERGVDGARPRGKTDEQLWPGAAARIRTNASGNMGVTGVQLHLLLPGDRFNLRTRSLMGEEKHP